MNASPALSGILRDARINELADFLTIKTAAGRDAILTRTGQWTTSPAILEKRSFQARCLKSALSSEDAKPLLATLRNSFDAIADIEPDLTKLLQEESKLEEESHSQLLFRSEYTSHLNFIPKFLALWTFFKLWIFPIAAIAMPILTLIGPFIVIKYILKYPITIQSYINIAKNMYLGGKEIDAKNILHIGLFALSTFQSMYQPLQTHFHLKSIDKAIRVDGRKIIEFLGHFKTIRQLMLQLGIKTPRVSIPDEIYKDERLAFAYFIDNKLHLQLMLQLVGSWEVAYKMASHTQITPVEWIARQQPQIYIKDTCDTGISSERQIPFTIDLGSRGGAGTQHALLTGPNRGGKSTVLRALLRSVILSHTYGVAIGTKCRLTPFDWIQSSLRIEDLPGTASLFEKEVQFARDSLSRPMNTFGLICIDELFHSTNPPDAEAASRSYLSALWKRSNTLSIISTHIFPLVHTAPLTIQKLCCPAHINGNGTITYKYGLEKGICEVSSVNEIIGDAFTTK